MNKYSVIIPTLWESNRLHKLLSDLIECPFVDEIILIDNAGKYHEHYQTELEKVKLVEPKENLYIAGSWNLGVELSKNENIAIINDDVNFNPMIFQSSSNIDGIVGQASGNYHNFYTESPFISPLVRTRPWGWASFFMLQKKYWIPIPEQLKIWYNDDWIVQINPHPKWVLHNFAVQSEMSATIGEGKFEDIKAQDREHWHQILYNHHTNTQK